MNGPVTPPVSAKSSCSASQNASSSAVRPGSVGSGGR